ncbi:MAG: DNA methylase [Eubacteriales bacterium]|nr:DNA methylase [Eubacteriales bacterium]
MPDERERVYVAIDLKSFYASVECIERGLNPLTANLVVADASRTEKTICLAVSPALKAYGIPGRARLFEVVQKVKEINAAREDVNKLDYIAAPPRMALYMDYSTRIYNIYLKYIAPEDIHVYSVDEVIMDVTQYLGTYKLTARQLTVKIIRDVLSSTGITATAGIGSNMYLCKVALDIVAKHVPADKDGVRIGELDEMSYRKMLWNHRPLTDFWRVGKGYAKKLEQAGIMTMGDVARCSIGKSNEFYNEDLLYKLFGVNAELLIDHAWGWEPCTIKDVKAYKPENNSVGSGQVLHCPYTADKAGLIVKEMTDLLALDLVKKGLVTDQLVLTVGYDKECLSIRDIAEKYHGEITIDHYGRKIPKHAHGTFNLKRKTSSSAMLIDAVTQLYDNIVNKDLLVRRINIAANHVISEKAAQEEESFEQIDMFSYIKQQEGHSQEDDEVERERRLQQAVVKIKNKYGRNAVLKGMNLQEGGTAIKRNSQIGGHKA